jgi:tetratricopeptide (TPR) repeat protein
MNPSTSILKQIAWLALIPQFLFAFLLIVLWHQLHVSDPALYGLATFIIISYCLRTFIPLSFNKAMKLVKKEKFAEAIPYFEKSYRFFSENLWIDKYRWITLLSSSAISYQEMALTNITLCYAKIGDELKLNEFYEKVKSEFPKSNLIKPELVSNQN